MNIVCIGAGAWGTALAISASARGHTVTLWVRDVAQAQAMRVQRENARYLPSMVLPANLTIASGQMPGRDGQAYLAAAQLVVIATPIAALRQWLGALRHLAVPVVWLCKGFEASGTGLLGHEVCAQVAPALRCGVLSGPSFALEVARGQPTALVAASDCADVRQTLVAALHGDSLRVYTNADMVGVEVGGAVKNLLAIAAGLCDGLHLGLNARAALLTRGLAEMTRLGLALGARAQTFMGLSGLGDLLLTATGDLSRNRRVGLALAQGHSLAHILAELGHVAEGVYSARTVRARAQALNVPMPITATVADLLDGQLLPHVAVQQLLARDPREE